MSDRWRTCLVALGLACSAMTSPSLAAEDLLVFVSAFGSGEAGAIHAFRVDSKQATMKPVHRTTNVENPFFLALSPDRKYLYSIDTPDFGDKVNDGIAAFRLEGATGRMKLINRQSALGTTACYLDVDATGRTLVVANYSSGSVASLPIGKDGSLGKAATFIQHKGKSVNPMRQQESHAHCFVISPDNRFVLSADLGLDQVLTYRLDSDDAELKIPRQPFVRTPAGAGPRHLTFHPNGRWVYVIHELTNAVSLLDYNKKTGVLIERQTISTLPGDFKGTSYCADVKVTPDGRFVYGTNRGHDSIVVYRVGKQGKLKTVAIVPSLGKGPQNLAITPDGRLLLCANMPGGNVAVFRIDGKSGGLQPVGKPIAVPSPSCIMIR
ncbi:MAG: lactonase family protein [Planctomycetota bacterium]|nr:lactonase family protein [Planctomycetota bacterium]